MSTGFGKSDKPGVVVYKEELDKLIQQYKKIKKYKKSSLFAIKSIDGTEEIVSSLLREAEDNPL
jgi:hypothetical protein